MTDQPAECASACAEQHTYKLSTCALACTERYGGVAEQSWAVPCPNCKAAADRPCTRWDGSAASVACQGRWDLHDQRAVETQRAQASMVADAFAVPLHLVDTSQPVEHCGHQLPPLIGDGPVTECVLRPGHQGSHANETGARWIEAAQDTCLNNPRFTAALGFPVRCPHCATTVPPTHWTKHLQRHHPDEAATCSGEEGFCGQHGFHRHAPSGYCPHCGRGDCAPTADEYEQQRQRAEQAEAALARVRDVVDDMEHTTGARAWAGWLTTALAPPKETPDA